MTGQDGSHAAQHVGNTILMVMMDVDPEDEEEFHRWYNQQHIPERLEIPGYVSTRRFKLESGDDGMLKYLCIWEMDDFQRDGTRDVQGAERRPDGPV